MCPKAIFLRKIELKVPELIRYKVSTLPTAMKKTFALLLVSLLFGATYAQRVGYVDTEYIMGQMPEYKTVQDEIEQISKKWQSDLEQKYQDIEKMYSDYQAQEVLLPEDVRQQKQSDIFEAERLAKEYREKKFGYSGELFTLQESRVKPIQDRVFKAVERVAKAKRYDFIFDKSGEITWLYTNSVYDITQDVLVELGVANN